MQHAIDKHSRTLIVSNIELLLNYSVRFYERQFTTRSDVNKDALSGFERLLNDYFRDDAPQRDGVPSVRWCAEQLHLSANYFGDLVKKETGKSAQEYIQLKVIDIAKERMFCLLYTSGRGSRRHRSRCSGPRSRPEYAGSRASRAPYAPSE